MIWLWLLTTAEARSRMLRLVACRLWIVAVAALCAAAPAWAEDGPRSAYRKLLARIQRDEAKYWKAYANRWNDALESGKDKTADGIFYDPSRARVLEEAFYKNVAGLYDDYARIEKRRGDAALVYAKLPGEHTLDDLLKHLRACVTAIEKAHEDLFDALKRRDERTPIRRHGLERRRAKLVESWGIIPKASSFLADSGLRSAQKKDRRRRVRHRTAVLEALGRCGDEPARKALEPWLEHEDYRLRIVALEAFFESKEIPRSLLAKRLDDPNPVVRRALLAAVRERDPKPEWIEHLTPHMEKARGVEQDELAQTLKAVGRSGPGASEPFSLYGIRTPSNGVLILIDGGYVLQLPAEWSVDRKHSAGWWIRERLHWVRDHDDHQKVIARHLRSSLEQVDPDFHFNVAMLHDAHRLDDETLGRGDLVRATRANRAAAVRLVEKFAKHAGTSDLAGLFYAMEVQERRLARKRSSAPVPNTVFLVSDGRLGGLYLDPRAAIEAFVRRNRFHRIVVHAIRISGGSRFREEWLQGLAKASGGSYTWASTPPR